MLRCNAIASTVSHTENCLYDIKNWIEDQGSTEQQELLLQTLESLEKLYHTLQEE